MDKANEGVVLGHNITITERKSIMISGVKKVESFDNEEFLLETSLGFLIVKGNELEIIKLDTFQGNISIKGKVNSFVYVDAIENKKGKDKEDSMFWKLFK